MFFCEGGSLAAWCRWRPCAWERCPLWRPPVAWKTPWRPPGGKVGFRCANLKSLVVLRRFNHVPEMVNVYITMGNQVFFFSWVNPRTKWTIFNSKLLVYQRVTIQFTRILAIWWFNTSTNWTFFFGRWPGWARFRLRKLQKWHRNFTIDFVGIERGDHQ